MPLVFAVAVLLLVVTAVAVVASLRLDSPVAFALGVYVVAASQIVATTELLSFGRLVGAAGYLVAELVVLAAALWVWHLRGRPRPPALPPFDRGALRRHPLLAALAAAVALAVVYQTFLVFATPPNNDDSMSQHLSRTAAWLQHGGFHWIPDVHTLRENEWAPNGEFGFLYTFAFLGRDTAAAAVQLASECALLLAVAGAARRLGYSRPACAFAGLVGATLPQIALQSVTTQVDLLVASFVAVAAYFVRGRSRAELALAGLALGLAVGTKATALLAIVPLALLAAVSLPPRLYPRAALC
ncbi:MAG: glycosyltransferase 87 family protein, partial [Actinomycetota bacterium]|nr:glycosyltransferase 87 family protein [Actinomycetota bacterium]